MQSTKSPSSDRSATASQYGDLLRVSAYDRVASLLVAALVMVSVVVAMLAIVWWTSTLLARSQTQDIYLVEEEGDGEADEGAGDDRLNSPEMEEPGMEELDLAEPDVEDTLAAVTDAVSSVAATLDAVESAVTSRGEGGTGNRQAGSGIIPRWQRWEIKYLSTTLEQVGCQCQADRTEASH